MIIPEPANTMSSNTNGSDLFKAVTCPFCGLLCDDLSVRVSKSETEVVASGCARSRAQFAARPEKTPSPMIDGKAVSLERAVSKAAQMLRESRLPLLVSAGTDVAGMRALLALAEHAGGVVDHVSGDALMRNLLVLQDTGWISTTLTEVRNRADLIVLAGSEVGSRFPRFFERCLENRDALFVSGEREIWLLGRAPENVPDALRGRMETIEIEPVQLGEAFAVLRALNSDKPLRAGQAAGVPIERFSRLLTRMHEARYGVIVWAAGEFDFPHAELCLQSMCELVQELNDKTRFSVLPMGGSDGDLTATQVCTWQTGYPLRVSFAGGAPEYDPWRLRAATLIESGAADAIVFVSAFDAQRAAPASDARTIVIARAGADPGRAAVFIPLATPGIHHAGHLYRADGVVALRLRNVAESTLPSAAQVLSSILHGLAA